MFHGFTPKTAGGISDFDRTISYAGVNTSVHMFSSSPSVPTRLKSERKKLHDFYREIELNLDMCPEERAQHMIDWHHRVIDLFREYLTEDHMQGIIEHAIKYIKIRDNFPDTFHLFDDIGFPFIVYSAGVVNVIQGVLDHHGLPYTGIHGNTLEFNERGECTGVVNGASIHNENKLWESIPAEMREEFKDRTHVLLLGDSLGDTKMAPPDKTVINVGFLTSGQKKFESIFRKHFDRVIESDTCDGGFLGEFQAQLLRA